MKRSFLFLALAAGLAAGCSSDQKGTATADSNELIAEDTTFTATAPAGGETTECYAFVKNRDTVAMTLHVKGEEYTGELRYNFYEKDKNSGTFSGEMKGDTLISEYIFDAEGLRSVREAVFLRKDGKLYEGFGETEEKSGKVRFRDRSKLDFGNAVVLSRVSCE